MKHNFVLTTSVNGVGELIYKCEACGRKTTNEKDPTECKPFAYSPKVAENRKKFNKSNIFNKNDQSKH